MAEWSVEDMAGYISGNVKRKQVVDVLDKNGAETGEALGKLTRAPKPLLEKALADMEARGVIVRRGEKYALTDGGKAAATVLHSLR